jgi:hypothetical protein
METLTSRRQSFLAATMLTKDDTAGHSRIVLLQFGFYILVFFILVLRTIVAMTEGFCLHLFSCSCRTVGVV